MRTYRPYIHQGANFRIASTHFDLITQEIRRQRQLLEAYIQRQPVFASSLTPVGLLADAPEIARRLAAAARCVGVGPMAAVAGTMAQMAAEAALAGGASEAIVENGGDIFLASPLACTVGLFAGDTPLGDRLAFRLEPDRLPLALCSSSSRMGHSTSFGNCDLATVCSPDAALADAAATLAGNLVKSPTDLDQVIDRIAAIPGVQGVLLVCRERVALKGDLPQLVRNADAQTQAKITRDPDSHDPALEH
jgi:ApbE superfamily uncharacterized protein (UPF0280 family)